MSVYSSNIQKKVPFQGLFYLHELHNLAEQIFQIFYACIFRVSWCACICVCGFSQELKVFFFDSFQFGWDSNIYGKFSYSGSYEEEEELQAIFERTFGPMKRDRTAFQKKTVHSSTPATRYRAGKPRQEEYLLVDGYNIIFSWEELNELAKENIHAACDKLMDILSNYQGYRKCTLILVFDAYNVEGHAEEVIPYHNIYVVYTKEAETADQYIEKTVHRIGRQYQVTVATSDGLEQVIIMGQGAHRISAQGLKKEIEDTEKTAREEWHQRRQSSKTYLFEHMSEEMQEQMERLRFSLTVK